MQTVRIEASAPYDVLIGEGLIDRAGELTAKALKPCRCAIVTDDNVDERCGDRVLISFNYAGFDAVKYVMPGGHLIYSTCTVGKSENEDNVRWITENFPYELESLDPYIPKQLRRLTTAEGYLQLIPGIHDCDGFFLARLRRKKL